MNEIVEESGVYRNQLAQDAGLSMDTLMSWLSGKRNPTPESLQRFVNGLRKRDGELHKLADTLEPHTKG